MLKFWVHTLWKGMMEISAERDKIIKSLNELETEFKKGNVPESHYKFQKRQLTGRLETLEAAERVMRLQGKKITEAPLEAGDESENDELFKKYITSPGLKEKNIESNKGISQNAMIATALLIFAFAVGIGFGIYTLNIPEEVSSVSLYTNESAFPPFVLNNTTNMTNTTNTTNRTRQMMNTSKPVSPPVTQPAPAATPPANEAKPQEPANNDSNKTNNNDNNSAAGEPVQKKSKNLTSLNSSNITH